MKMIFGILISMVFGIVCSALIGGIYGAIAYFCGISILFYKFDKCLSLLDKTDENLKFVIMSGLNAALPVFFPFYIYKYKNSTSIKLNIFNISIFLTFCILGVYLGNLIK